MDRRDSPSYEPYETDPSGTDLLKQTPESDLSEQETPQKVSKSVHDFLKQSNQIQAQIQRISKLCQNISPKQEEFPSSFSFPAEENWEQTESQQEYEEADYSVIQWGQLNSLLLKHNFNPLILYQDDTLQELPDLKSISEIMLDLITEFAAKKRELQKKNLKMKTIQTEKQRIGKQLEKMKKEMMNLQQQRSSIQKADHQIKELDKSNRVLQEKLDKTRERCQQKQSLITNLREQLNIQKKPGSNSHPEKEKYIFRAFMHREYNPNKESDSKILGIIVLYEEQKQKIMSEFSILQSKTKQYQKMFKRLSKQVESQYSHLHSLQAENNNLKSKFFH